MKSFFLELLKQIHFNLQFCQNGEKILMKINESQTDDILLPFISELHISLFI